MRRIRLVATSAALLTAFGAAMPAAARKPLPQLRDAGRKLVDAAPAFKQQYNPQDTFLASLQAIQAAGLWVPADCGGDPCTDMTTPAAKDIIVDWTAVGMLPADPSLARHAGAHAHQASDWATGPSTMGAPNP